jgi:hypothetical protein
MAGPAAIRSHSLGDTKIFQKKSDRRPTLAMQTPMFAFAQRVCNSHFAPKSHDDIKISS